LAEHYDVIIVGSGAGGGTLAHRLAPSGKRVLILERGDFLPREPANWDPQAVFADNRYVSPETWYDAAGPGFQPQVHYVVGGATKFSGSALFRLRERDFAALKHHDGVSPAWPVSYDDMEPYYAEAEELYQVHGLRGEDPTEPAASGPYPYPPVSHEPRVQRLFDDLRSVGLHPFHTPSGVLLDETDPVHSRCIRCATCDGFPCLVQAKSDSDVIAVRPALRHDNVTLVTRATVRRLLTDSTGRVVETVVADVGGEAEEFRADVIVLSAGAVNSAKLLLASASDKHPRGLANGSDQVGRNYMCHNARAYLALSVNPNDTRFQKTLGLHDYYFGDDDFGFPMGSVQLVGRSSEAMYRGERVLESRLAPMFGMDEIAERAVDFWLSVEDLPRPGNRVTLNGAGDVVLSYTPNNQLPMEQLYHRVKRHLSQLGMLAHHLIPRDAYMKTRTRLASCAHQAGTVRFGTDPESSVLDADCKAHELDNLYVVDTSFFPGIGAVNPALTAMANALRVGDRLLARLEGSSGQLPKPSSVIRVTASPREDTPSLR
jgi:choline dehydrogenase-like flavoprotein